MTDDDVYYRALTARDTRFDGLFFVGVKTTGIYCRPVCTAKTPGRKSCRFFASAALAERAGFRPCLRCRPELAPGCAMVDSVRTTARTAAARIEAGALTGGRGLEELAASLGVSSRQLRRSMRRELGVSPIQLAQTNRLLLAKRLIAETSLPMVQVALAAGFESVRRFNSVFRTHYRLTPSALRRVSSASGVADDCLRLTLAYRPPLAWDALLRFLAARAISGVECVSDAAYARSVCIGEHRGWLRVAPNSQGHSLLVELSASLAAVLPAVLARLRNLLDLDARPDVIAGHLRMSPMLAPLVGQQPGLRVPGAFDSFELAVRAIVGQQVSVRAASTLAGRIAERFGETLQTPLPCIRRLMPTAQTLHEAPASEFARLGLPTARAASLRTLSGSVASGQIDLQPVTDPVVVINQLTQLPGIGPWTAQYIAMRALRWPDAFPEGDLGLKKATEAKTTRALQQMASDWRPWRAYAAMHLWESLGSQT